MILPEIGVALNRSHYACWGANTLEEALPKRCPCCGALPMIKVVVDTSSGAVTTMHRHAARYTCGAEYKVKPQGQTHTEVYWGVCPARAEPWGCDIAGMAHDAPPYMVADRLDDLGYAAEATQVRGQCKC